LSASAASDTVIGKSARVETVVSKVETVGEFDEFTRLL